MPAAVAPSAVEPGPGTGIEPRRGSQTGIGGATGARTRRARSGAQAPTGRHQVGLTVPRTLKNRMLEAASVLEWSLADWVLAAAAEFGPDVPAVSGLKRRQAVPDVTFCALYVTPEERAELDDQARYLDMNRSAFVTAVAQLALGASPDAVEQGLRTGEPVEIPNVALPTVRFRAGEEATSTTPEPTPPHYSR